MGIHEVVRTTKGRQGLEAALRYGKMTGYVASPFLKTLLKSIGITYKEFKSHADGLEKLKEDAGK